MRLSTPTMKAVPTLHKHTIILPYKIMRSINPTTVARLSLTSARRVQPNDYSNMAYFNGLLCLIVGCYTIYLSWKVRNCYEKEDYNGALVASRRCFWIHFVVFSVAGWLLFLVIALYIFYGFAVAKI
ncbi:uncharacterized protein LOC134193300 isoform X1 [Corticium candelabrum]|uniref:uncharacterized protein LOC134193300 isoform X1 n=1 Tax=Corticium candelabrum TaxID=121492 RepID=UPI002E25D6CE|nr:uncharacterized protein LOC134193300 isoform X1 [Corticium candelabrum]